MYINCRSTNIMTLKIGHNTRTREKGCAVLLLPLSYCLIVVAM